VEPILFNLDPKPTAPRHWLDDTWLNSSSRPIPSFGEFDWDTVPKMDYAKVLFRQLATPENAKVFDDAQDFVLETFGKVQQITVSSEEESQLEAKVLDDADLSTAGADQQPPTPSREPLPLAELADPAWLQGPDSFWSPENSDTLSVVPFDEDAAPELDSAALAAAREEAFAQGQASGMAAGRAQGLQEGHAQGVIEGQAQAIEQATAHAQANMEVALATEKAQLQHSMHEQIELLKSLNDKLQSFSDKPDALFEPLKRLAVHISEQLVLAELNLSGQAIERLVQRCLDELDSHGAPRIVVELNPQDKARLQDIGTDVLNHIQLQSVSTLHPGSVRLLVDDTQIEDLIEHRLQAMANRLLSQPELWREQSAFFRQPLAQRDGQVEDVPQRVEFDEPPEESAHD
jgi:flagellar assembly protein FliH